MKKIVPIIKGGLGNQLFIYASMRRLSEYCGSDLVLDHVTGFENDTKYSRNYKLHHFLIDSRLVDNTEKLSSRYNLKRRYLRAISKFQSFESKPIIVESQRMVDGRILDYNQRRQTVYFDGYWQSEKCFSDIASSIRCELKVQDIMPLQVLNWERKISNGHSTALHVRLFYDSPSEVIELTRYYQRAIQFILDIVPDTHFFIFSEDETHISKLITLPDHQYSIVKYSDLEECDIKDFYLMTKCHSYIIAKSTFSWWAAWLGESEDTIIVAPAEKKFTGTSSWGFKDLLPDRWVLL